MLSPARQGRQGVGGQGHLIAHAAFGNEQAGVAPYFGQTAFKVGDHEFPYISENTADDAKCALPPALDQINAENTILNVFDTLAQARYNRATASVLSRRATAGPACQSNFKGSSGALP